MNEEVGAAAIDPSARLARQPEDLRGADLRGQDLTDVEGLLPEHLAGADLTGARLPDDIAKSPALEQVNAISVEARKVFIGLLAACVYSWLVIGTTTDVALVLNTASSPLPIINTPIPISGFYVVGAALLAAVYCYLHFYLQRLWRTLATLPAVFPDGTPLDDRSDPWLLASLIRLFFGQLSGAPPPLTRLENLLSIFLAWWLVPLTLMALWARYLPAHYWIGTAWLVATIVFTIVFGRHSYRLARAALRGQTLPSAEYGDSGVLARAWHEFCELRPDRPAVGVIAILIVCSLSAFRDNPRDDYTYVAKLLNYVGIRTYADLREVEVAQRPEGWDSKNWESIKQVDLQGRNLAFADARRAFLPGADLRAADLTGAVLDHADLRGADFYDEDRGERSVRFQSTNLRFTKLQGADLRFAQLQGVNLVAAQLQGADLANAQLQGADLANAQLQGVNLEAAQLQGASLEGAKLQGADLEGAQLQGAILWRAQFQGADLRQAQLQGAEFGPDFGFSDLDSGDDDFFHAVSDAARRAMVVARSALALSIGGTNLKGADLKEAGIWRASFEAVEWELADLRGTDVEPMEYDDVEALISEATKGMPDENKRKVVGQRLTGALQSERDRPSRPKFPEIWQSEPNVMFDPEDPNPEPFNWGQRKWSDEAYQTRLADLMTELACSPKVPVAQIRGIARRALDTAYPSGATGGLESIPLLFRRDRWWTVLLAERVTTGCPPARGLTEEMLRELEVLAANAALLKMWEAFPTDPAE